MKNIGKWVGSLAEVTSELTVMANIVEMDALKSGNHGKVIAAVETLSDALFLQRVEDGAVLKGEAIKTLPLCDFCNAWAVIKPTRRSCVQRTCGWAKLARAWKRASCRRPRIRSRVHATPESALASSNA